MHNSPIASSDFDRLYVGISPCSDLLIEGPLLHSISQAAWLPRAQMFYIVYFPYGIKRGDHPGSCQGQSRRNDFISAISARNHSALGNCCQTFVFNRGRKRLIYFDQ